jgi:hypothetical protein
MNSFAVFAVFMLAAVVVAEPPSGYNYQPAQSFGGGSAGGFSSGGGFGNGGGYQQVPIGQQTNEGQNVDPQLLEQIRQILLQEESKAGAGGAGRPSSQYGAPQPQYGPPAPAASRVVGIELENVLQAMQVAQFLKQESQAIAGGYSRGPAQQSFGVSSSYGAPAAPSNSYGAPAAPSSSYGAPAQRPSSSYGAPF